MVKKVILIIFCAFLFFCTSKRNVNGEMIVTSCDTAVFPDWETSDFVLPFAVGDTYFTGLSACSSSYHGPGQPDQFAIDFNMPIRTEITASIAGTVVHVEESGFDYDHPNNLVVVDIGDNFIQYMHLTNNGAVVEVGDTVEKGDLIGYSGATGLAGYPHLHFVVTAGSWQYPYTSTPVTFKNTSENPSGLNSYQEYTATSY